MKKIVSLAALLVASAVALPVHAAIPLKDIFARPEVTSVKISPEGDYLAARTLVDGLYLLVTYDTQTLSPVGAVKLGNHNEVDDFYWVNKNRLVFSIVTYEPGDDTPYSYGELLAVDADGKNRDFIYGYRAQGRSAGTRIKEKEAERAWGEIIDVLPGDGKKILISSTKMTDQHYMPGSAFYLDVYSGKDSSRLVTAPYPDQVFYTDDQHQIRLITSVDANGIKHVHKVDKGELTKVPESLFGGDFYPASIQSETNSLFALATVDTDYLSLFKYDLQEMTAKKIYQHKSVDVTDLRKTVDGSGVYAIRVDDGYPSYLLFSKTLKEAAVFKGLLAKFGGMVLDVQSRTLDGRWWTVRASQDTNAGDFYLYDAEKDQLRPLMRSMPQLAKQSLVPVQPIKFMASDKVEISGYLTKPENTDGRLVVLVHGGPHARDYWEYNAEVQALASRGYAVLQVNFRGSTGYGYTFRDSGDREWGRRIQQDIIDGTRWALEHQHAKAGKICIAGASFGGYSALQASILTPDLYACAVANAGIYDLPLMYEEGDTANYYGGENYLKRVIGTDAAELKQYSPSYRVSELKTPVFIAHGKKDKRAPIAHAESLRKALDKAGKKYEWYVRGDAGHGFHDVQDQVEFFEKAIAFMDKHIH